MEVLFQSTFDIHLNNERNIYEFNVLDCRTARAVNIHENGYTKCYLELNHECLSFSEFSLPLLYELH